MRITQNTIYSQLRNQMSSNAQRLLLAQEKVATQKKINRLSENPVDGGRVLDLAGSVSLSEQYIKNIDRTLSIAGVQDSSLSQVQTLLTRAKSLLLAETNEVTSTAATRESARIEFANLTSQLVQAANTRFDGQAVYAGFAVSGSAFADATVAVTAGAVAGGATVTRSQVSDVTQLTFHDFRIQFTAPGQYDILDTTSGTTVASAQPYTSGDSIRFGGLELQITNSPGAPQAGDTWNVNVTAAGAYLGDGNLQQIEIQPGSTVQQNLTGDQVFQGVGLTGGTDIFNLMNSINSALATNDRTTLSASLDRLDSARTQISNARASVGARVNLLETVKDRQSEIKTNLETLSSNLEDIDVADAMTALSKEQDLYEATLSAGSKIIQPSLLDFLR